MLTVTHASKSVVMSPGQGQISTYYLAGRGRLLVCRRNGIWTRVLVSARVCTGKKNFGSDNSVETYSCSAFWRCTNLTTIVSEYRCCIAAPIHAHSLTWSPETPSRGAVSHLPERSERHSYLCPDRAQVKQTPQPNTRKTDQFSQQSRSF
eukprot:COSAG02_NODE_27741_length_603_cov_1.424603_1_plen_150_part_00